MHRLVKWKCRLARCNRCARTRAIDEKWVMKWLICRYSCSYLLHLLALIRTIKVSSREGWNACVASLPWLCPAWEYWIWIKFWKCLRRSSSRHRSNFVEITFGNGDVLVQIVRKELRKELGSRRLKCRALPPHLASDSPALKSGRRGRAQSPRSALNHSLPFLFITGDQWQCYNPISGLE